MKRALRDLDYSKFRSHEVSDVFLQFRVNDSLLLSFTAGRDISCSSEGTSFFWFTFSLSLRLAVSTTQP